MTAEDHGPDCIDLTAETARPLSYGVEVFGQGHHVATVVVDPAFRPVKRGQHKSCLH